MVDESTSGRAYQALKKRILALELTPAAPLEEAILVEELGVSRTPVREALFRLTSDGLVVRTGRGHHVTPINVADAPPLLEAHEFNDRAVNRLAALRRTESQLETIRAACSAFEALSRAPLTARTECLSSLNRRFHATIAEASANPHLAHAHDRTAMLSQRLAVMSFGLPGRDRDELERHLETVREDHRALVNAIASSDADQAEQIAVGHARQYRRSLSQALECTGSQLRQVMLNTDS